MFINIKSITSYNNYIALGIFISLLFLSKTCLAFEYKQNPSLVFNSSNPKVFYFTKNNSIYRTFDQGLSWQHSAIASIEKETINAIFLHPSISEKLYVCTLEKNQTLKIYRSTDNGKTLGKIALRGLPVLNPIKKNYLNLFPSILEKQTLFLFVYEFDPLTFNTQTKIFKSIDSGISWSMIDLAGLDPYSQESIIINPHKGIYTRDYLNPWYAITVKKDKALGNWQTKLFKSSNNGNSFKEIINANFPKNQKFYAFLTNPLSSQTLYALSLDNNLKQHFFYSTDSGKNWKEIELWGISDFIDRMQINPNNGNVFLYTVKSVFEVSGNSSNKIKELNLDNLKQLWNQPGKNFGQSIQLYLNKTSPKRLIAFFENEKKLFISENEEKEWQTIYPFYEARWESQIPSSGLIGKPGEKIEVEIKFLNTGNVIWQKYGPHKLGLYVYKDQNFSTPPEYNNPTSPLFGQSYFADIFTWGASANGLVPNSKAAKLVEDSVAPLQLGTFSFHFLIPSNAIPNALNNSKANFINSYYREDLSVAYGTNWMPNKINGDHFGIAHVWFPITVL